MNEHQYLTVHEAAEALRLSVSTVRRLFDTGVLTGFRVPGGEHRRIDRNSVLELQQRTGVLEEVPFS